eukprot:364882-Chlamydomonas_euryale.AAC.5
MSRLAGWGVYGGAQDRAQWCALCDSAPPAAFCFPSHRTYRWDAFERDQATGHLHTMGLRMLIAYYMATSSTANSPSDPGA